MNVFRHVPGYETHVYEPGKEALFLAFVSFLVAFFLTRLYTRQARIRGWGSASIGGVHLHHAVPGVVLALIGGLLSLRPGEAVPRRRSSLRSPSASAQGSSSTSLRCSSISETCTGLSRVAARSTR